MSSAPPLIPIYFPFTSVSRSVVGILYTCFDVSAVYVLSDKLVDAQLQRWSEAGWLDIRIPVTMDPVMLGSVLDHYRSWADQHGEAEKAYLKIQGDRIPFFEDHAIAEIIKGIRENQTTPSTEEDQALHGVNRRRHAGLFLHAAGIFDAYKAEMSDDLRNIDRMEADLFSNLRPDGDPIYREIRGDGMTAYEDTGSYMVSERITSWARLMTDDGIRSGLFITSSPAVLAYLLDKTVDARMVLELDGLESLGPSDKRPAAVTDWQNDLSICLGSLLKGPWPAAVDSPGSPPGEHGDNALFSLVIYIIPGQTPTEFFGKLTGGYTGMPGEAADHSGLENTLIGLICPA